MPVTGGQAEKGVAGWGGVRRGGGALEERMAQGETPLGRGGQAGLSGVADEQRAGGLAPADVRRRALVLELHGKRARLLASEREFDGPGGRILRQTVEELRGGALGLEVPLQVAGQAVGSEFRGSLGLEADGGVRCGGDHTQGD